MLSSSRFQVFAIFCQFFELLAVLCRLECGFQFQLTQCIIIPIRFRSGSTHTHTHELWTKAIVSPRCVVSHNHILSEFNLRDIAYWHSGARNSDYWLGFFSRADEWLKINTRQVTSDEPDESHLVLRSIAPYWKSENRQRKVKSSWDRLIFAVLSAFSLIKVKYACPIT